MVEYRRNDDAIEVPLDRILTALPILLGLMIALYLATSSFYTVAPHEEAVVLRFGKYHTTTKPGLHFRIPLVDRVMKVSMEEHSLRLPFDGGDERSTSVNEEATLMLTGDLNAAAVEWTVQWKVTIPEKFLFSFQREGASQEEAARTIESIIMTAAHTVMNQLVGDYSIDEVLTDKRGEIGLAARTGTQEILDRYECGVTIRDLQMQRVTPPDRVKPSFDEVNSSIQRRDKLENEANKIRNELLPKAYAAKDKLIREAQGYADRRRSEASGEIAALLDKYQAYQKAPEVTRQRLYLEAMEEVLRGVENKTIIDGDLRQILPLLDLNKEGN